MVGAYEFAGGGQSFCAEHFVRPKVCNRQIFAPRSIPPLICTLGYGGDTQTKSANQQHCPHQFSGYGRRLHP